MKICLTGGHLTPAQALAAIAKAHDDSIIFIGRQYTDHARHHPSQEPVIARQEKWLFQSLSVPKKLRITALPQLASAYRHANNILHQTLPDIVVAFGSYFSVPVGLAAKRQRLPLLLHEQTAVAGLANRLLSPFADRIAVSFPSSQTFFPRHKTLVTGNPLRPEFSLKLSPPSWLPHQPLPLIYITGGNQGSMFLNQIISAVYSDLGPHYRIVHQCGGVNQDRLKLLASIFPHPHLQIREQLTGPEAAWCLTHADLVISRAGANTVNEIIFAAVPSVLIPLPQARYQEQLKNAQIIEQAKAGMILTQNTLTPAQLNTCVSRIMGSLSDFRRHAQKLKHTLPVDSAKLLYQTVQSLVSAKKL